MLVYCFITNLDVLLQHNQHFWAYKMVVSEVPLILFNSTTTSAKFAEIARKNLGETEELKQKRIEEIRHLLREHKVTSISTSDFILRFLRIRKFNLQRSFDSLRNYAYQRRTVFHNYVKRLQPEVLETCLRLNLIGFLHYRDAEERIVIFIKAGAWTLEICSLDDYLTVLFLLTNYAAEYESSQTTGVTFICDMTSLPLSYLFYYVRILYPWKNFMFNCVPVRYADIQVISKSLIMKYMRFLIFPVMPKKLVSRMVFHEEVGDLKHFHPSILPDIFGGTSGPLNTDYQIEILKDYLQKVKDEYRYFLQDA